MKKATEAALISALVFPGAGHLYLKKYVSGLLLLIASGAGLWYLITMMVERTLQVVEKIQSGMMVPDVAVIIKLVTEQPSAQDVQNLKIATVLVVICWLISIVDSYRVGLVREKEAELA